VTASALVRCCVTASAVAALVGGLAWASLDKLRHSEPIEALVWEALGVRAATARGVVLGLAGIELAFVTWLLLGARVRVWLAAAAALLTTFAAAAGVLALRRGTDTPCGCGFGPDIGLGGAVVRNLLVAAGAAGVASRLPPALTIRSVAAPVRMASVLVLWGLAVPDAIWLADVPRVRVRVAATASRVSGARCALVVIENTGDEPVVVGPVRVSCACVRGETLEGVLLGAGAELRWTAVERDPAEGLDPSPHPEVEFTVSSATSRAVERLRLW